jgi:hypothetical protein
VFSSVERDESPKSYETSGGCPRFYLQMRVSISPWIMDEKKDATNELASLISSLNLGSEDMPIKEYVQLVGEDIVDA